MKLFQIVYRLKPNGKASARRVRAVNEADAMFETKAYFIRYPDLQIVSVAEVSA